MRRLAALLAFACTAALAQNSDTEAQLGRGYLYSEGVGANAVEALKWFDRAVQQNHEGAGFFLAILYHKSIGAHCDLRAALTK